MLKLYYSPSSPFVRKVLVSARETGQFEDIELLRSAAHPVRRDASIVDKNPLGKVPTLLDENGDALFDSRVICEFLDARSRGARIFPADIPQRWRALTQQSLGDGIMDAALLLRYEQTLRPAELRWEAWSGGQFAKIDSALDALERASSGLDGDITVGAISVGCALGYLDFRFQDHDWRAPRPKLRAWFQGFSQRAAMEATAPFDW